MKFHVVSYFGRVDNMRWRGFYFLNNKVDIEIEFSLNSDLTDKQLEFKSKCCMDLLRMLDQVTCGDSQKKGEENV